MIPAPFITQDRDIEAAVFCLRQFHAKGLSEGLQFLIPVQSGAAEIRFRAALPEGLSYRLIYTPWKFGAMVGALAAHLGDAKTLFFASSDRYPVKPVLPSVFAGLRDLAVSDRWDGVRLCAWKEEVQPQVDATLPDGTALHATLPGQTFGSWHPQFMSRGFFDRLIGRTADRQSLGEWQDTAMLPVLARSRPFLVPATQVTFLEEPISQGSSLLNYHMRCVAAGQPAPALENAKSQTKIFTHSRIPAVNDFYAQSGIGKIVNRALPAMPVTVHSVGGAGSKMLLRWIYSGKPEFARKIGYAHSHWRLPPVHLRDDQSMVYIFGNPVESVLSFFARRESRHARHGFFANGVGAGSGRADFATSAQAYAETPQGLLTDRDDAASYLDHGSDLFRTEEHLNNYLYADRPYQMIFVRYETLWRHTQVLQSLFPGAGAFPEFIPRRSRLEGLPPDMADGYESLYGGTTSRMAQLPDVFTVQNGLRNVLA